MTIPQDLDGNQPCPVCGGTGHTIALHGTIAIPRTCRSCSPITPLPEVGQ